MSMSFITNTNGHSNMLLEHNESDFKMSKYKVAMVRHGESQWTVKNLFCGWYDAPLSKKGLDEAIVSAKALSDMGLKFDVAHTSLLQRAHQTLDVILREIGQPDLPIQQSWRLNERHYGALTGFNKAETADKYGSEQVQIWRRSFDILPPPMNEDHRYYADIVNNPKFKAAGLKEEDIPRVESLKSTMLRVVPYWNKVIVPQMKSGKKILIVAHGTSLRSLLKHIDEMPEEEIMKLNLPTGIPFLYEFDRDVRPVVSMRFLSDKETVERAMAKVASIGKGSDC